MAQFSAEPVFSLYDIAIEDDAATVAGADYDRDRGFAAVGTEDRIVATS